MTRPPRNFGDPQSEYLAATTRAAFFDRTGRPFFHVGGRAPGQMLKGIVTGRIPEALTEVGSALRGEAAYSALLTPKGKMVTDLTVIRAPGGEEAFWLDVPQEGEKAFRTYLARVLPPRLAKLSPMDGVRRMTVVGPEADTMLASALALPPDTLAGHAEQVAFVLPMSDPPIVLFRPPELGARAWEIVGAPDGVARLEAALSESGAAHAGTSVWETLRVEGGRPRFGVDMNDATLPIEAGIGERAIDMDKGCYTGQEVIVRIAHRGHVNRHLRHLHLGEAPTPAAGTELFLPDQEKSVGWITSAVSSPRFDETLALGYVRREVEPGGVVRVGSPDGASARVAELR